MAGETYKEHVWAVDDLGREYLKHAKGEPIIPGADDDDAVKPEKAARRSTKAVKPENKSA